MKRLQKYHTQSIGFILLVVYMTINSGKIIFLVMGGVMYFTIFRGFIDGAKLLRKGLIKKSELWKPFVPFWMIIKYFKPLFLED